MEPSAGLGATPYRPRSMRVSLRRVRRFARLHVGVPPAVAVGVEHLHRPALRKLLVARLVEYAGVEPRHHRAAAAEPQLVVLGEIQVVRAEAGVHGGDPASLRIPHLHLPVAARDGERLRRGVVGACLAERGRFGRPHPRRNPDPRAAVHGEAVRVALAVPDYVAAPVGRRHQRQCRRRGRRVGVADLQHHPGRRVLARVEHGHVVGAVLGRAVDRPVGVHRRIALVGRDQVVHVGLGLGPVPQADDHVAFDALWPGRGRLGILAAGDALGPVAVHRQRRLAADLVEPPVHVDAGLPRLDAAVPGVGVRLEVGERGRNLARRLVAELVAAGAAVRVDDAADPRALAGDGRRDAVAFCAGPGKVVGPGNAQQREPVLRRVVLGGGPGVGRRDSRQVEHGARIGLHLLGIHQAVAPHPHVVGGRRQVGHQVAAVVIRDHDLGVPRRQLPRLGDHPDARFGAAGTGDDAGDVVVVHG